MTTTRSAAALALVVAALLPQVAHAQSLAARIDGAPAGHVQFSFSARPGVCGNGRTYIQTAPGSFNGSFNTSITETLRVDPCEPGPVRVILDRADREIIAVQTYVGPSSALTSGTDLGRISPQLAADYLLQLAARSEGRVGRDAIFPATLADSAITAGGLVAIARNQALPRETRSSALSYVGRSSERMATVPSNVVETLLSVARDESDNLAVRKQALTVLGRIEHGAGVPPLVDLARQNNSMWLAREAMTVLASSGDPRARTFLRSAVQRDDLSEEAQAIAIRALGQQFSTRQDAVLLRSLYPRLNSDRTRDAVLAAVADVGGAENVRWLIDLARSESETSARARRALDHAARAGAPIGELVRLYDTASDYQLKDALVAIYARSGERAATDKLIAIARTETNVNVRRRAIAALSNSDDPRVKEALRDVILRD
ncbi:MAG: HEAT repeat domain-containing protein [Longimicrobiales bacterium]